MFLAWVFCCVFSLGFLGLSLAWVFMLCLALVFILYLYPGYFCYVSILDIPAVSLARVSALLCVSSPAIIAVSIARGVPTVSLVCVISMYKVLSSQQRSCVMYAHPSSLQQSGQARVHTK